MELYSMGILSLISLVITLCSTLYIKTNTYSIEEATIDDLQLAFKQNKLTSKKLVDFYIQQIHNLNPLLKGVIELNPDAIHQAKEADRQRKSSLQRSLSGLHGIPILLKDIIATKDKLNTTAGSFALLGSVVARDAGVVVKLRNAGAIVLGKASLSEWSNFRSSPDVARNGFSPRGGQGKNPYVLWADPSASSSGSAISVASNMVSVSLGSETDGSILSPASANSVVGIKPTVGLTSRSGVIPISPRQDTVGPLCRTVSDAVYVLDAIVGYDQYDAATKQALKYIPSGGYKQFLKINGLQGKRLGIVRNLYFTNGSDSNKARAFTEHLVTLRENGAVLVEDLEIENVDDIAGSELTAMLAEFKLYLNVYLKELLVSPVRSLADVIAFNQKFPDLEKLKEYGQAILIASEATNGIGHEEKEAISTLQQLSKNGFEKLMEKNKLDAVVTSEENLASVLAIGGFPGISVPAGYDSNGVPFGIFFGGLKGSEPELIEISYAFEQSTKIREPPSFKTLKI